MSEVIEWHHRIRHGSALFGGLYLWVPVGVPVIQDPAGVLQSRVELLRIVGFSFSFSLGFSFSSSLGFSFSFSSVSVSVSVSVAVSAQFQFLLQSSSV